MHEKCFILFSKSYILIKIPFTNTSVWFHSLKRFQFTPCSVVGRLRYGKLSELSQIVIEKKKVDLLDNLHLCVFQSVKRGMLHQYLSMKRTQNQSPLEINLLELFLKSLFEIRHISLLPLHYNDYDYERNVFIEERISGRIVKQSVLVNEIQVLNYYDISDVGYFM